MATRLLLAELAALYEARSGWALSLTSVGGVDAAKRVQAGEAFDLVFLAADAIDKLAQSGHVLADSVVPLAISGVAVAVPEGAAVPDLSTEEAVKQAVLAAPVISYSTGPSGTALLALLARWGIADLLKDRLLQAPPGVPVGELVAQGKATLGFQQLSELMHISGITLAGALPASVAIDTMFCGAVSATSDHAQAAREALAFMVSADADDAKHRQGMRPA